MAPTTTPPGPGPASEVVLRARGLIERGERWRARDLLVESLDQGDAATDALVLLGEVLYSMGDLPAAGAAWFGASVKGPEVDVAMTAWRERYHDDVVRLWESLPRSVRAEPRPPRVEALRARALQLASPDEDGDEGSGGFDAAQFVAWVVAALFVVCAVVGLVEILRWMVPQV